MLTTGHSGRMDCLWLCPAAARTGGHGAFSLLSAQGLGISVQTLPVASSKNRSLFHPLTARPFPGLLAAEIPTGYSRANPLLPQRPCTSCFSARQPCKPRAAAVPFLVLHFGPRFFAQASWQSCPLMIWPDAALHNCALLSTFVLAGRP